MGASESRIPVNITLKKHDDVKLHVPYKQLEMIKLLQSSYRYEVKGTLYFGHDHKFKSFEIRTDEDELFSSGASDWKISFHTHPDKTAQKYGIRYYSPPSVDDVMEVYDYSGHYLPESIGTGEVSIIITNEGIYVLQVNRDAFKKAGLDKMSEKAQEKLLNEEFNSFIVDHIKDKIRAIYAIEKPGTKPNFDNPEITYKQLSTMVKTLSTSVTAKFGFNMMFYDWDELKRDDAGLLLNSNTYFIKKVVD